MRRKKIPTHPELTVINEDIKSVTLTIACILTFSRCGIKKTQIKLLELNLQYFWMD